MQLWNSHGLGQIKQGTKPLYPERGHLVDVKHILNSNILFIYDLNIFNVAASVLRHYGTTGRILHWCGN
jgi:hypothetical protein